MMELFLQILRIIAFCVCGCLQELAYQKAMRSNGLEKADFGVYKVASCWSLCCSIVDCVMSPLGFIGCIYWVIYLLGKGELNFWAYLNIFLSGFASLCYAALLVFAVDLTIKGCKTKEAFKEVLAASGGLRAKIQVVFVKN